MLDAHPHQKTIFKKNGFKIHFTCFPVIKTANKQLFLYDSLFLIPVALRVFECVHKMTQSFPPFLLLMLSSLLSVPGFFFSIFPHPPFPSLQILPVSTPSSSLTQSDTVTHISSRLSLSHTLRHCAYHRPHSTQAHISFHNNSSAPPCPPPSILSLFCLSDCCTDHRGSSQSGSCNLSLC